MPKTRKVLLLTNYRQDKQRSMLRFGELLSSGLNSNSLEQRNLSRTTIATLTSTSSLKKWSSLTASVFPKIEEGSTTQEPTDLLHVIDHSNALPEARSEKFKNQTSGHLPRPHCLAFSKNEFPNAQKFPKLEKNCKTGSAIHWERPMHTPIHPSPKKTSHRIIPIQKGDPKSFISA